MYFKIEKGIEFGIIATPSNFFSFMVYSLQDMLYIDIERLKCLLINVLYPSQSFLIVCTDFVLSYLLFQTSPISH